MKYMEISKLEPSLMDEIREVVVSAPEQRHSYFQLKHFVIDKEPTHQAKLWQCLRELKTRQESIENINFEIEEANDRLGLIDIREEKERLKVQELISLGKDRQVADIAAREWEIKKRQNQRGRTFCERNIAKLKEKLAFLNQEAKFFLEIYKKLSEIEPVRDFDDLEAQTHYWNERLSQEVTLRTLLSLPLDAELAKTILALADGVPAKERMKNSLKHASKQLSEMQVRYLATIKEKNAEKEIIQR